MSDEGIINGKHYEYPHCNSEVLHAPGECHYCDAYPQRQRVRAASGTSFTPNESNGWSGNVAAPTGSLHSHMGATYIVGRDDWDDEQDQERVLAEDVAQWKCGLPPTGWYCKKRAGHAGPCPTYPRWWTKLRYRLWR